MKPPSVRAGEGGYSLIETLVAFTLVTIALMTSFAVLQPAPGLESLPQEAGLRLSVAERVMEETLALSYAEMSSRQIPVPPEEVGGRRGWTAEVRVTSRERSLKEVAVTVRGFGRSTSLRTLVAPWRAGS